MSEGGSPEELRQRLVDKDQVIAELKKIVGHLSGQARNTTSIVGDEELQDKIRVLTI